MQIVGVPSTAWPARIGRLLLVTVLGFASGLPLALTGQALQAWMSVEGLDLAAIGFLSLVGLPYTFKFLWAPLIDRFDLPVLGRRRGWMVLTQVLLAAALWGLAQTSPVHQLKLYAAFAVLVAFLSASQDVVIDAYRTELLKADERGMGASLNVMGYRMAMIVSGGLAFIWTDAQQGGGWSWPQVYELMALFMLGLAAFSAVFTPRVGGQGSQALPASSAGRDLMGFVAVMLAVALGVVLTDRYGQAVAQAMVGPILEGSSMAVPLQAKWVSLVSLLLGLGLTIPLAAWAARAAGFATLLSGLSNYFAQPRAWAFLGLIVLYKLGDAFAGSLMTPFLLKSMAFSSAEVGVVNKVIGLWLTIGGALLGGALMMGLGLWRALLGFGVLQMASNLGLWWLAANGKGSLGWVMLPAFDWGFVKLAAATPVDGSLLMVIAFENLSGGMGTAAFVAFLMSLCNQRYTATQFALLSAFASVGRVWVGPMAGVLAESIGWPVFFLLSTALAFPGLWLLWWLRSEVRALEGPSAAQSAT
jgi:PAT family beta-lactamase induction signal transducer AmpG